MLSSRQFILEFSVGMISLADLSIDSYMVRFDLFLFCFFHYLIFSFFFIQLLRCGMYSVFSELHQNFTVSVIIVSIQNNYEDTLLVSPQSSMNDALNCEYRLRNSSGYRMLQSSTKRGVAIVLGVNITSSIDFVNDELSRLMIDQIANIQANDPYFSYFLSSLAQVTNISVEDLASKMTVKLQMDLPVDTNSAQVIPLWGEILLFGLLLTICVALVVIYLVLCKKKSKLHTVFPETKNNIEPIDIKPTIKHPEQWNSKSFEIISEPHGAISTESITSFGSMFEGYRNDDSGIHALNQTPLQVS
jgi:hypothetical protein